MRFLVLTLLLALTLQSTPADPVTQLADLFDFWVGDGNISWKAWADNPGGFFKLAGSADGDKRLFSTALVAAAGQVKGRRMVFHHITKETRSRGTGKAPPTAARRGSCSGSSTTNVEGVAFADGVKTQSHSRSDT